MAVNSTLAGPSTLKALHSEARVGGPGKSSQQYRMNAKGFHTSSAIVSAMVEPRWGSINHFVVRLPGFALGKLRGPWVGV